jgi:hypothetical protein
MQKNTMTESIGNKDTAIRWLLKKIDEAGCWAVIVNNIPHQVLEQALEKEEEQIVDAWHDGYFNGAEEGSTTLGENYYSDNYGFIR